jgi:hypothetical protein
MAAFYADRAARNTRPVRKPAKVASPGDSCLSSRRAKQGGTMADIAIGEAITAGFGVIRRKPLVVLLWGLAQLALTAVFIAMLAPFYITLFKEVARAGASGTPPNAATIQAASLQVQGLSYLLNLIGAAFGAVIYCAVFRSVLHPERSRYAYLRVSAAEGYTFMLMVAGYIAFFIALLVAIIPIAIVVGILAAVKAPVVAVFVGIFGAVAAVVALIYVLLRFSLVVPMMVDDGKFHLMESWAVTRGKVGSLFVVGLGSIVLLVVGEIVVLFVMGALGAIGLAAIAGDLNNLGPFFKQPTGVIFARLAPLLVVFAVIWAPIAGCALALWGAPWAKAYRDLVQPDVSGTFT